MKRWVTVVVAVVVGLLVWQPWDMSKSGEDATTAKPDYVEYVSAKGKFKVMVPNGWTVEEASDEGKFRARAVFRPTTGGKKIGTAAELAVTVLATESAKLPLASQEEFEKWQGVPEQPATESAIWKVKNEMIGGQPGVRLAEVVPIQGEKDMKFWSMTSWMRKDGVNYYLSMMGNGPGKLAEQAEFSWMVTKFELIP